MDNNKFKPNERILPWVAKAVTRLGKFYNRYQVRGLEHVPSQGGALIVLYHGLIPIDFFYFGLKLYLETGRTPCALADRWVMNTPGMGWLFRAIGGIEAHRDSALEVLREGNIVGVSPGGVREAISGTKNNYKLIWGERKGFAQLAIDAGVPIIPGFTQNVEGLYKAPFADRPFFQNLYEKTKLPLVPIIGLGPLPFPVPLTTWLAEPIVARTGESAESLVKRTRIAIESLISEHQLFGEGAPARLPGK